MKYIFRNDFNSFKKFLTIASVFYILPLVLYYCVYLLTGGALDKNLISQFLSYNVEFNSSKWIFIIISILNVLTYFSLIINLIIRDLTYGYEYIFLRLNIKSWLLYKIVSLCFYIFIYTVLRSLLFVIIINININIIGFDLVYITIYQFILFLFVAILLLFLVINFKNNILPLLVMVIPMLNFNLFSLIVMTIIILFLLLLSIKNNNINIIRGGCK